MQLTLDGSIRVLLVGCHLAAHADQVAARNIGFHRIVSGLFHNKQASASALLILLKVPMMMHCHCARCRGVLM